MFDPILVVPLLWAILFFIPLGLLVLSLLGIIAGKVFKKQKLSRLSFRVFVIDLSYAVVAIVLLFSIQGSRLNERYSKIDALPDNVLVPPNFDALNITNQKDAIFDYGNTVGYSAEKIMYAFDPSKNLCDFGQLIPGYSSLNSENGSSCFIAGTLLDGKTSVYANNAAPGKVKALIVKAESTVVVHRYVLSFDNSLKDLQDFTATLRPLDKAKARQKTLDTSCSSTFKPFQCYFNK